MKHEYTDTQLQASALSKLRPLSEAGAVPEGCIRVRGWEDTDRWYYGWTEWEGDTHFADIMLPEAKAPAVEAEKPDPYAELKKAHADEPTPEPMSTKSISLPLAECLSLRDWFAGQALAGIVQAVVTASLHNSAQTPDDEVTARWALKIADAMLAAREVKP